jgi:hypothetical protein
MSAADRIVLVRNNGPDRLNDFTFPLNPPLDFGFEPYEVAVLQACIPKTWDNVTEQNCHFDFYPGTNGGNGEIEFVTVRIPTGRYESAQDLVKVMRRALNDLGKKNIFIEYLSHSRRCLVRVERGAQLSFRKTELGQLLGFGNVLITSKTIGEYDVELDRIDTLQIYCDAVKPSHLGDVMSPLLCVIPTKMGGGRIVETQFASPIYRDAIKAQASFLHIRVSDASGQLVPFRGGDLFLKLHFKKKNGRG